VLGMYLVFKGKELGNNVVWPLWLEGDPTLLEKALALERVNSGPLDHA